MRWIIVLPTLLATAALVAARPASAQTPATHDAGAHAAHGAHAASDTAFESMQRRGQTAMGVDQYTSIHRFDALRDGGRIELQRDGDDSAGAARIQAHMREIARAFTSGDFGTPAVVHMKTVPGADVMRARRRAIRYEARDLPRGAALDIHSADPAAIAAIHRFLAFQRAEHRVPTK
jgi:hypothetical protein